MTAIFWTVVRLTAALLVLMLAAGTIALWQVENDRPLYEKLVQRIGTTHSTEGGVKERPPNAHGR